MAEHKNADQFFNFAPATTPVTTGGLMTNLTNTIDQGFAVNERIGDKITVSSLELKILIYCPVVTSDPPSVFVWVTRIVCFIWKDDDVPNPGDIFDIPIPVGTPGNNQPYLWPLNHDKKVKRKILYDKTISQWCDCSTTVFTGCSMPVINRRIFIPFKKLGRLATINYVSGSSVAINHVYFFVAGNVTSTNAASSWIVDWSSRINFIDM